MKSYKFKICLNILTTLFFISSCVTRPDHSPFPKSEQKRFEEFFKRFLFLEDAVYTLYGSKPITEIVLSPEKPEERLAIQQQALTKLSKADLAELNAATLEYEEGYWFEETWAMWEEMLKTLPIKRYLFVERTVGMPEEFQNNRYIYFINIAETAKVLQKHYSLFREHVGFDFDPLSVVFEAKNPDSPFWNEIWGGEATDSNVCLMGILFGYGFENSYLFSWHFAQNRNPEEIAFLESFLKRAKPTNSIGALKQFNPPKSFLLPGYASFSELDAQKEQYKQEYKRIRAIYMESDIIERTMQQLLH